MGSKLMTAKEAEAAIKTGAGYLVAADERLLRGLPAGNWIGGTIPYFMTEAGGVVDRDQVFMTALPPFVQISDVRLMSVSQMPGIYRDIPANGFGVVILPASTPIQMAFALEASSYPSFAVKPLIGWVAGIHLSELDQKRPKVFDGRMLRMSEDDAVVMYINLPDTMSAEIGTVNLFTPGEGDLLEFAQSGFRASQVLVNGEAKDFARYLTEGKFDTKLPMVTNHAGTMINVGFQRVDVANSCVDLYGPVFAGVEYRLAKPIGNYIEEFRRALPQDISDVAFSCNCILNFLYSELEGKKTGGFSGPAAFGEVAYQLLNQTLVYLRIE